MSEERDPFEEVLSKALRVRPEHVPMLDIAGVALSRVRLQQARVDRLARISFWTRVSSAAAVLLIVGTVAVAYWKWPTATSTTATTVAEASDTTDTSSTSSSSSLDMTTIGGGAFLLAILAVAGLMVLTPERPAYRLTPA